VFGVVCLDSIERPATSRLSFGAVRVVAVVPTYNEAENIEALFGALRAVVPSVEIVVVDDSSPDGTAQEARQLGKSLGEISVIERDHKAGLGSAYRAGLRAAIDMGADICVQIDADLSHDPGVLPALVANVEHGADLAIGSRYVPGGLTQHWPWRRRWLSRWGNRYAAGVLGLAVNDATSGYRAYRSSALSRMDFESVRAEGYGFQIEMTHRLVRAGGKIVEFPITFRERSRGESKLSKGIVNEAVVLVARLWIADRRGRRERRRSGG
jgi:dolichol-phosphate mannosyltransferase